MKVCKVVVNSVSHDARVLKEAEAIRESGCDVVIIGIQDANNNTPIQILENGVVIRRVAWQAQAFKPFIIELIGKSTLAFIAATVLIIMFTYVIKVQLPWILTLKPALRVDHVIQFIGSLLVLSFPSYFGYQQLKLYLQKRKSYRILKKREEDELLKYEAIFDAYNENFNQSITISASSQENSTSRASKGSKKRKNSLRTKLPRPLLESYFKAIAPTQIRKWKVIFAREICIYKILKHEKPDVVHAHDLSALPVAVKYTKKRGVKLVFDAHEIYDHLAQSEDDTAKLNSRLLKKYEGSVYRFITINDSIARYYRNNYHLLPSALVIKNAAKPAELIDYDGRLHQAAGLSRDKKIIIYQGGYAPKRGLIQLLMAAEYLNPEWSLVYMGWGTLEDELHRVADALLLKNPALSEKIRFVPKVKQEELPYWTSGATIGAIPYENTGLNHWYCNPNKLWEYPNSGVPIIASPFPEMSEIISAYELGWYLPDPLNPKVIAEVINELTEEQIATASLHCRKFIEIDNWDVYAGRLKTLYGEMQ